jgi:hypothetical protein
LRLKDNGHNASSVRSIVKIMDQHLHAVSIFVLQSPEAQVMLARACINAEAKAKFLSSDSPNQVRTFISDYDLLFKRWFTTDHLLDTPVGYCKIEPFEKLAVLALWKFAAAKEAYELAGEIPAAISLALEGMTSADMALTVHEEDRLLPLERHHIAQTTKKAVAEVIEAKKQESKAIRRAAAKLGNARLWDVYKRRAFELASSRPFSSYSKAADFIQPALQKELTRHASHRKIGDWIKEKGWSPTKG